MCYARHNSSNERSNRMKIDRKTETECELSKEMKNFRK